MQHCQIDWLAMTFPCDAANQDKVLVQVLTVVGGSDGVLPRGRYGYSNGMNVLGTGAVLFAPSRPEMGVHLELPSSALAALPMEVKEFLSYCLAEGAMCRRLDVALDTDAVSVADVVVMESDGTLVSRTQNRRLITDLRTGGQTLYVGAPSSRRLVRIYDKRIEAGYDYDCTRIEVQFRADFAHTAAVYVLAGHALEQLIASAVDFRGDDSDRGGDGGWLDSNVSRRKRCGWWQELLHGLSGLSFAVQRVEKSIEAVYTWFTKQYAATAAILTLWFGGSEWFENMVQYGCGKLTERHVSMLGTNVPTCSMA